MAHSPTKLLITGGPTREHIDDVRFLSNPATGTIAREIAQAALNVGWQPTLILGPSAIELPKGLEVVRVVSAQDMYEAVVTRFEQNDIFVSAAAVADFTPAQRLPGKLKKGQKEGLTLEFVRTHDILLWAGKNRRPSQTLVGFALEASGEIEAGMEKLQRKGCDLLVHNTTSNFGEAGGGVQSILSPDGLVAQGSYTKQELAKKLIEVIQSARSE